MRMIPSWGWSCITIGVVLLNLSLGAGGPEGRTLSRSFYWIVVSLTLVTTLFSYLSQHRRPTRKLGLINLTGVVMLLYLTLPLWHFGVQLPVMPGARPVVHWWVNLIVFGFAAAVFISLRILTRPLQAGCRAVEDKPARLTV